MKTIHRLRPAGAFALLLSSTAGFAQTSTDITPDITTLTSITVTAGRGSELENLPISTTVIPREEVINSPEQQTDQILNKIPGFLLIRSHRHRSILQAALSAYGDLEPALT